MIIWLKPVRAIIDLKTESFEPCAKAPSNIPVIDLIVADPGCTATHLEERVINFMMKTLLHVCTYDLLTVLAAVLKSRGRDLSKHEVEDLFHENAWDALNTVVYAGLHDSNAPGEFGYYRDVQLNANRKAWGELHSLFNAIFINAASER